MAMHVCTGAILQCSCGAAPSPLLVPPTNRMLSGKVAAANIMDHKPLLNIMPFAVCTSPANPAVAAATAAALGVLTPMPCLPATATPWLPGVPNVLLGSMPALDERSKLACNWGGVISVVFAGQVREMMS